MTRFRLKSATMALRHAHEKDTAITIPAGAEILAGALDHSPTAAPNRTVQISWNGDFLTMFQIDLIERGEDSHSPESKQKDRV